MQKTKRGFTEFEEAKTPEGFGSESDRATKAANAQHESPSPSDDNENSRSVKSSMQHAFEACDTWTFQRILKFINKLLLFRC